MEFDQILTNSLHYQSGIDFVTDASQSSQQHGGAAAAEYEYEYSLYLTTRLHKNLLDYKDVIEFMPAYISKSNAEKIFSWTTSLGIAEITNVPKISRKEVIIELNEVFQNVALLNDTDNKFGSILQSIYNIFVSTMNDTSDSAFTKSATMEIQTINYNGSNVSETMSNLCELIIHMITFNKHVLEMIPLVTSEFATLYIMLFTIVSKSRFHDSIIFKQDVVIVHIFGMLIIDVLTDKLSRELWLNGNVTITKGIMNHFREQCPGFRTHTSDMPATHELKASLDRFLANKQYSEYNLQTFLYSSNFDSRPRIEFLLNQIFQNFKKGYNHMGERVIAAFEVYINELDKSRPIIYDNSLILVFLNIEGFMEMIKENAPSLNFDMTPFEKL